MANTYSQCFYHIVFSTKERVKFISPDIEQRVWAYIGGILKNHDMTAVMIGGIDDHIHVLVLAKPSMAPSRIAQLIKGESSKWIHTEFPRLGKFAWQDGYAVFTVNRSIVPSVADYIKNQREHHSTKAFEAEYRELLKLHEIDYDERYLLG
jgi:REP element-mobilizing transposase RayT